MTELTKDEIDSIERVVNRADTEIPGDRLTLKDYEKDILVARSALAKLRQPAPRVGEANKLIGVARPQYEEAIEQLMRFYNVTSIEALVCRQNEHIEKLQARLPRVKDEFPRTPREG